MTNKTNSEILGFAASTAPTLILMRHAARDFHSDRLSADGRQQSLGLSHALKEKLIPRPTQLECSPKVRTQATLKSLALELQLPVAVELRFDEQVQNESGHTFKARIETYCNDVTVWAIGALENAGRSEHPAEYPVRLVCSHLDWLELAVVMLSSDENDFERCEPWPPMTIRAYSFTEGIWKRLRSPR